MAIRKIARMGHAVLKGIAAPVEDPRAPDIARLAEDLVDTCEDIGGSGIAAPQIHEPLRVFVYRVPGSRMPSGASMQPIPWTVCVNPEVEPIGEETSPFVERCLSLPGLYGEVPRHVRIRFAWTDLAGERHALIAQRFHARLLQHEHDHLDGILYPMRMTDMSTFGYVTEPGPVTYASPPCDPADFLDPEPT